MVLMKSNDMLKHGDKAPDFTLLGTDEQEHSLSDLKGGNATLIVFICNHCPYVLCKLDELDRIAQVFCSRGLRVICINSNDDEQYPEDSFENMQKLMREEGYSFVYLHDPTQEVAKAYGAVCTPDPFLFDGSLQLIFRGRIDDGSTEPGKTKELANALREFFDSGKIMQKENPSMGCSIKWK